MGILNRPSHGLLSVLVVLYKVLLVYGKTSREKLLDLCAPATVVEDQKQLRQTLNTWLKLSLFAEESGEISLAADVNELLVDAGAARKSRRSNESGAASGSTKLAQIGMDLLPRLARKVALRPENNSRFWEAEEAGSSDFTRALCWMLAQDAYSVPGGVHADIEPVEIQQLPGGERLFPNNTRWDGFKSWAPFLGFGWSGAIPSSGYLNMDPAVAVRDSLPEIFGTSRELTQETFFERLAQELPVVDGGRYRLEVEARLADGAWETPADHEISTSLSRALERLHSSGVLQLEARADADKKALLGQNRQASREVSHLIWNPEAA